MMPFKHQSLGFHLHSQMTPDVFSEIESIAGSHSHPGDGKSQAQSVSEFKWERNAAINGVFRTQTKQILADCVSLLMRLFHTVPPRGQFPQSETEILADSCLG